MPDRLDSDEERMHAYRHLFARGTLGPRVLSDLMQYARLLDAGIENTDRGQEFMAGRRDVICYILDAMGLSRHYEEIARVLVKAKTRPPDQKQEEGDTDAFDELA